MNQADGTRPNCHARFSSVPLPVREFPVSVDCAPRWGLDSIFAPGIVPCASSVSPRGSTVKSTLSGGARFAGRARSHSPVYRNSRAQIVHHLGTAALALRAVTLTAPVRIAGTLIVKGTRMKARIFFLYDVVHCDGEVVEEAVRLQDAKDFAKTWNEIVHGRANQVSIRKAWRCERLSTSGVRRTGKKRAL